MLDSFVEDIKFVLKQYPDDRLYLAESASTQNDEKLGRARTSIGIPESEELIAVIDETFLQKGNFGLAICRSGLCWRSSSSEKRQSISWEEVVKSEKYIKQTLSGLSINSAKSLPIEYFSKKKLEKILLDCKDVCKTHQISGNNLEFLSFQPTEPINSGSYQSRAIEHFKKHYIMYGVLSFVLVSSLFPNTPNPTTTTSSTSGKKSNPAQVTIQKGSLFCQTKEQLDYQSELLARNVMEFAPGCLSTGTAIDGVLMDIGLGIAEVRAYSNGHHYWVFSNAIER